MARSTREEQVTAILLVQDALKSSQENSFGDHPEMSVDELAADLEEKGAFARGTLPGVSPEAARHGVQAWRRRRAHGKCSDERHDWQADPEAHLVDVCLICGDQRA